MDTFGSHARKRESVWRMLQDLDMNDNRITSLGHPKDSSDAVTKRWVTQQLKDGMKDLDELESVCKQIQMTIKRLKRDFESSSKELTKKLMAVENGKVDKSECVSTNGGKMKTDLDMQKFHVLNLPLPQTDNEPITKAVYDRLQSDLDVLRIFVELKHA
ncbi:Hypothetical predicted protein [Mytilus galloprovincialis]|uniref:Uncharacterized protein n=1 Tax=Mytilus galloprovincialis TaxID=29158 RepID=A0A8B6EF16_MYTGA|nr:Hypothetical predicted protein [Mytilus galloprovincialis]